MAETSSRLWGRSGFREDDYSRVASLETAGNGKLILPLAAWLEHMAPAEPQARKRAGVLVAAGEDMEPLLPFLAHIPVLALDFPVFGDGRSYSKAVRLRTVHHYRGELRAVGNVLIDQVSNMLRCGFDTLEVTHPLTCRRLAQYCGDIFPSFYQPGAGLARAGAKRAWRPFPPEG